MSGTVDAGTRLPPAEYFNGPLAPFLRSILDTKTLKGFGLMNEALKDQAEAPVDVEVGP
ncbi:MAG: hypothetical protein OES24_23385 [Acidimicrobiia bacterium]|nr:hypothetical protein [Acidimicrobiia bacterium]